jgi:PPE-repeat protein
MDFGTLPPEINSGRMYSGPGSGSTLAAAAAWDGLAAQLRSTAASYSSAVSGLTADWQGPSSIAMAAAAAPYAAWLRGTAAQAEETGAQARAAAAAYETAFAATVPPPVIATNRDALASLVATNILGQNMPAIAAAEAQYADMWAQDAAAMYGYAGQSATASQVTSFTSPPQTTDPGGQAAQSATATQAVGTSAGASAQSTLGQPMSAVPAALQALAAPTAPAQSSLPSWLSIFIRDVLNPFGSLSPVEKGAEFYELPATVSLPARNALVSSTLAFNLLARGFSTGQVPAPIVPGELYPPLVGPAAAAPAAATAGPVASSSMSAGLGEANLVGSLSVPPSWAVATPAVRLAATVLQGTGPAAAPLVAASSQGGLLGQMALASLAGSALGNTVPRAAVETVSPGAGHSSRDNKEGAGNDRDSKTQDKLKRVLAELSQKPESVQHWHTDKAHLEGLLEELSHKPGVHAVHVSARDKPIAAPRQPRWG